MATPLDILFETRTLLESVNDPEFETEPRFLVDNFWGGVRNTFSKYIDWEVNNGKIKLARFRPSGAQANVVSRIGREVKTVQAPNIREKMPITAPELFRRSAEFGQVFVNGASNIDSAREDALADDLKYLRQRIEEREEWMCAQLLTSPGIISYEDEDVAWEIDMDLPNDLSFNIAGTSVWGGADSNVANDLEIFSNKVRSYTGAGITDVIMDETAATALRNDASVREDLKTINFEVGRMRVDFQTNAIGRLYNINFWSYQREYTDENGVTQNLWPAGVLVGIGATFKRNTQRTFGLVEEVEETFADQFFSKSWVEQDPSVRWVLVSSRPLPIAKQVGSWMKAEVVAA
jgi:hypothetical protein